jgi:hypothetical protein
VAQRSKPRATKAPRKPTPVTSAAAPPKRPVASASPVTPEFSPEVGTEALPPATTAAAEVSSAE